MKNKKQMFGFIKCSHAFAAPQYVFIDHVLLVYIKALHCSTGQIKSLHGKHLEEGMTLNLSPNCQSGRVKLLRYLKQLSNFDLSSILILKIKILFSKS